MRVIEVIETMLQQRNLSFLCFIILKTSDKRVDLQDRLAALKGARQK